MADPTPKPVEQESSPINGQLQPPAPPAPAPPQAPAMQPGRPPSVADKVAGFVTGGQQTPGQLFRGILSGALTGMVAGAGQRHFGPGVSAGGQAVQQQKQQRFENQMAQTREQGEEQLRNAQIAKLNHDIYASSVTLSQGNARAMEEHADAENKFKTFGLEAPGSVDLGVQRNVDDLMALHKQRPDLPQDMARGNIYSVPHFEPVMDAQGKPTGEFKYDGVSAMYVPTPWLNTKIDHDVIAPEFVPGKKPDEPGHWEQKTLFKAGTVTNKEAITAQSAKLSEAAKYDNDAQIARANAAMLRAQAALKGKPGELDNEDISTLSHQLATHPENVSLKDMAGLRNNLRSKILTQALRENPQLDLKAYNIALDTMKDFTSGKVADNLTAFNGAIRHLSLLGDAARAFGNGEWVTLNRLANEVGAQIGKDNMATYNAIHAAVSGEVEKVYKGAAPTDVGMTTMGQAFNQAQSPQQAAAAVRTTMQLMGEKVQDYYRRFSNGTHSTPEREGIQLVNPDVQETLGRWGVGSINASGPPAGNNQPPPPATAQMPPGVPADASFIGHDPQGNVVGYKDAQGNYHALGKQ